MGQRVPNRALRALRERTASEASPGEAMSRQELAERVAAYAWDTHRREVAIDGKYVAKLERGAIARPRTALYREALRSVLGVATDADLGFVHEPFRADSATTGAVDRRSLITGVAALAVAPGPLSGLLRDLTPTPVPAAIGRREVEQVLRVADSFQQLDLAQGGGVLRAAATAQARWAARLLDADYSEAVRPDLFGAVGYMAYVAGFMAFDDGALADARRLFEFALRCAEEAGDWQLRAFVLHGLTNLHLWAEDFDAALTYGEQTLVRSDRLTATERAGMWGLRAHALAGAGRARESSAAIGTMDDEFARSSPGEGPRWISFYTEAQHLGATGRHYCDLALAGDRGAGAEAVRRMEAAIPGQAPRSAAFSQVRLAILGMSGGDLDHGVAFGMQAAESATGIRSHRLAVLLRELHACAARHAARSDVADMRERLAGVIAA